MSIAIAVAATTLLPDWALFTVGSVTAVLLVRTAVRAINDLSPPPPGSDPQEVARAIATVVVAISSAIATIAISLALFQGGSDAAESEDPNESKVDVGDDGDG